jgi:hypothetical protein
METFLETKHLALPLIEKDKNQTIFEFFVSGEGFFFFLKIFKFF